MKVLHAVEKRAKHGLLPPLTTVNPVPVDLSDRRQFSFSELDGALRASAVSADFSVEPSIDGDRHTREDARFLGTLVHALLAELPTSPQINLAERARHHADLLRLTVDASHRADLSQVASPDPITTSVEMVRRFQVSARYQALQTSSQTFTEIEFLLAWPLGGEENDGTHFRGFIDCLFQDPQGRWHVLDYKTNRVTSAGIEKLAEKYELQMLLYALAVEQTVGEPPASLVLSFLQPGVEYAIPYGTGSRQQAIGRIEAALDAYRRGVTPGK
jgi:ATP-dependent exoDNAse (exonuclease V) beta subunit